MAKNFSSEPSIANRRKKNTDQPDNPERFFTNDLASGILSKTWYFADMSFARNPRYSSEHIDSGKNNFSLYGFGYHEG